MTDEQLNEKFSAVEDLIRDVAGRIDQRFDALHARIDGLPIYMDQQFTMINSRLDRVETNIVLFNRAIADHDRVITGMLGTQEAQRRAIDTQQRAIDDILRRLNPPQ